MRVGIDHQNATAGFRHEPGQMNGEGRLADTAFLVVDDEGIHRSAPDNGIWACFINGHPGGDRDFAIMQRTVKRVRWTCDTRCWFEPTPRSAAVINRTMSKTAGKIPCQKSQGRPMANTDDDLTANSRRGRKKSEAVI
ncbi:hypothetical protein [Tardiphaga sp.]|uniref:hypothetical protein n=1 Tax=Tardiphaga sp. TaxID=1926292 RepID=UPI00352B52A6